MFRCFNTSRFQVLGSCSRLLTQARLLGLDELMESTRASPESSEYWLHLWQPMFDDELTWYFTTVGMGGLLADSLYSHLLEDPRVALHAEVLSELLSDEIARLQEMPDLVWQRLQVLVGSDMSDRHS